MHRITGTYPSPEAGGSIHVEHLNQRIRPARRFLFRRREEDGQMLFGQLKEDYPQFRPQMEGCLNYILREQEDDPSRRKSFRTAA